MKKLEPRQILVGLALAAVSPAFADYDSHPEIRPEVRCGMIAATADDPSTPANEADPGGPGSIHCQRLIWDIPAPTEPGARAIAAPFDED